MAVQRGIASLNEQIAALDQAAAALPADRGKQTPSEQEALKAIAERKKAAQDKHKAMTAAQALYPVPKNSETDSGARSDWIAAALVLLLGVLAGIFVSRQVVAPTTAPLLDSLGDQLTFLGFAVALAAYLQSVARDLKEKLHHEARPSERTVHANNLWYVVVGEQMIVGIGIATAVRIVLAPAFADRGWFQFAWQASTDRVLLSCLAVTTLYLAVVHVRQWRRRD